MRIGVDIDGVIVDTVNFVSGVLSKHYGCEVSVKDVAHGSLKLEGIENFFNSNGEYLFCSLEPISNSVNVINELGKEHDIFIISARHHIHYDMTIGWLNSHGFAVKDVLFTEGKSKLDVCNMLGIDLFIEDSVHNASELVLNNIRVLLYDTEYNRQIDNCNIVRCSSWLEILDFIKRQ